MNLFDQLVGEALRSRADLTTLRPVVEKELLLRAEERHMIKTKPSRQKRGD